MRTVRVLDSSGDTCIQFDETEATAEARAKAKEVFDGWMAKKLPAFQTHRAGGAADERVTDFGQIEDGAEVLLIPAIVAG